VDLKELEMVEEAVLGMVRFVALPSRLKTWMRVETRMYNHPIVDRILYTTRYVFTGLGVAVEDSKYEHG